MPPPGNIGHSGFQLGPKGQLPFGMKPPRQMSGGMQRPGPQMQRPMPQGMPPPQMGGGMPQGGGGGLAGGIGRAIGGMMGGMQPPPPQMQRPMPQMSVGGGMPPQGQSPPFSIPIRDNQPPQSPGGFLDMIRNMPPQGIPQQDRQSMQSIGIQPSDWRQGLEAYKQGGGGMGPSQGALGGFMQRMQGRRPGMM